MIRSRLTRTVLLTTALVLIIFSASVFWSTRALLLAEVERDVSGRLSALASAIEREGAEATGSEYVGRFGAPDVVAIVFDGSGTPLGHSNTLVDRQPTLEDMPELGAGVHEIDSGGPLYVATRSARLDDDRTVVVAVGRAPDRLYQALGRLAVVLGPATVLALAVIGGSVFLSIRRALRPLEALDAEAGEIATSGDHRARINGTYQRDEVGALAESVDSMLISLASEHDRAQQLSRAQQDFLADVSHELRAPLALVGSSLELAERAVDDDRSLHDQLLADARSETARMGRIVTQLLIMVRTGADTRAADQPLLISELILGSVRRWAPAAGDLEIDVSPLAPLVDSVVLGNADHLTQVFDVLLDNATKFTPAGGRIEIAGQADDEILSIAVQDTGCGIAPVDLDNIFDRFYRGQNGDTGLGLAIARHIVESHGGTVTADNRPTGGVTITVRLPKAPDLC